jgi:4-amino-4-deoxy-L-arabinose transferase-like glycosyltransferase
MAALDRIVRTGWAYAVLAAALALASLPGVFSMPVLDRDEARFAQATAQMLETGDFVVIRYHEGLRNKKPVGIHWMQSATVGALSSAQAREIWAYRIPSLLGAALAVLATFWGGQSLFSRRAAFLGAGVLATCLILTSEAHIAKTDAALAGVTALGAAALARLRAGQGGKRESVVFWACLGAGVLLKGVISPMVFGLMLAALALWERKWDWMRPLLYWVGISLFCVMTIPWFIAVQIATSGAFLHEAATVDLGQKIVSAAEGHEGPPGLHLAVLPLLFWPGTLLLIPALLLAFRAGVRGRDAGATGSQGASGTNETASWRFLICWAVPAWLIFEIAPTKLVHYTLPAYPAIALAAGALADRWLTTPAWGRAAWVSFGLFVLVGVLLAVLPLSSALAALRADYAADYGAQLSDRVGFLWSEAWRASGVGVWPTLLILAAIGFTSYAFIKRQPLQLMAGLLACALTVGFSYRALVLPNQSWMLATNAALSALEDVCALPAGTRLVEESGCIERPPETVRAFAFAEPSFVFSVGGRVTFAPKAEAAIPAVEEDFRPAFLIDIRDEDGAATLRQLIAAADDAERCLRMSRRFVYNYSNGSAGELVAAVVEPGGCVTPLDAPAPREEEPEPEQLER